MQVVPFPARQARTKYRHELRHLTYVTLDAGNGGIIRNLNRVGMAVQAVAPLHQQQRVRIRFELRFPRVRVETYGQVSWAHPSGQCGIRFVDLPPRTAHQIDEWIFSNLIDIVGRQAANPRSMFAQEENAANENDGLILSPPAHTPIRFEAGDANREESSLHHWHTEENPSDVDYPSSAQLNWLSRPLSGKTLTWLVDGLLLFAALMLFALIFLSITHELPPWPITLGAVFSAVVLVTAAYWFLFAVVGRETLGVRLAQSAAGIEEKAENGTKLIFAGEGKPQALKRG